MNPELDCRNCGHTECPYYEGVDKRPEVCDDSELRKEEEYRENTIATDRNN